MTAVERIRSTYARIREVDRAEVWIALRPEADAIADAEALDARVRAGENLPLAGWTLAVKDNIDALPFETTAACPAFAFAPQRNAAVVQRLLDAGAVLIGKTNLDQFATGLVGARSPYGAVRDAARPDFVSGGSSSGSAVAVALGLADIALGTDTAGSGRVPAAFQGIVGLKPTRGLVSVDGVVPACRSFDCVTVFARDLGTARTAIEVMEGVDERDPLGRPWPESAKLAAPPEPLVGVPDDEALAGLTTDARDAFDAAAARLVEQGAELVTVDLSPYLEAGRLLYEGAFVAERYAAVGTFVDSHRAEVEPTVGAIIGAAGDVGAADLVRDSARLDELRRWAANLFTTIDALLLPTTTRQPTIADVAADPVGANARLGRFTNGVNLLDLCAAAVPAGTADGGHFGVTIAAPAFADRVAADIAALLGDGPGAEPALPGGPPGIELFVVGAHLSGEPLNGQLTGSGARLLQADRTAPSYRLHRLDTEPPKPGLVRVATDGVRVPGERWLLSPAALGRLLSVIPQPMALGPVELESGTTVVGFLCEPIALDGARDITSDGGWRAHLARGDAS